ncbi:response regulator [Geobacillus sp. G4]|uniref:Transcriptional regulatory protein n=4 Tax=Geobacillus TaxID=129337 RepID=A0A7U9P6S6_GEOTM|nr:MULTISPECIES: response regulator [Geobacillus]AEV19542.1 Response regulator [Geobacillus thermoleovorans CCB_US3_UF5]AMV11109.1 two-component system response regulator [Geobacillus thermoleovorans]AOL34750.1 two-component system response regulator [Geobacillus thermoleovorans]AUI35213.1 two-component system response regulator [[Bacillus] caldolyticus]ESU72685.1 chemotaxis protein CheY [Geobacillus sp. MAS1]
MIRVLIIEDDRRIAEINRRFVEKVNGYEVVGIATNAEEARELTEVLQPDVLLLDVYFPDMNGLSFLKWVRERFSNIDIIMITAAREVDALKQALHGGVFDYIIKPIMFDRFAETLHRYKEYYDKMQQWMKEKEWIDQEDVDKLIGREAPVRDQPMLPKGIQPLTLEKVLMVVKRCQDGVTAEEVGRQIGTSRTTARRYLEYLVSTGQVLADIVYGSVGRPERIYKKRG